MGNLPRKHEKLSREELLERRFEKANIELVRLRGMCKRLMKSGGLNVDGTVEEILTLLKQDKDRPTILSPVNYKPVKLRNAAPVNPSHFEYAVAAWSDWHLSEKVKPSDSNGVNAYSSTIGAARVWEQVQRTKRLLSLQMALYPIKKIHLLLIGDFINGSIHEELKYTNDLTDIAATILAARILVMAVLELRGLGIPIQIDAVVGNHPRTTVHMPTKNQAQTSYDWLVYEFAYDSLKQYKDIQMNVHSGQIAMVDILGWRYILEHGIDWANGKEEDMEDRLRALFDDPIYREATGLTGSSFDQVVIGDRHKGAFLERTVKNGCLPGQNELGQSWRLKPIRSEQLLWGVSKDFVRTFMYRVDTTDIKSDHGSNPILDYAKTYIKANGR